jgi:hypothetical protein
LWDSYLNYLKNDCEAKNNDKINQVAVNRLWDNKPVAYLTLLQEK